MHQSVQFVAPGGGEGGQGGAGGETRVKEEDISQFKNSTFHC